MRVLPTTASMLPLWTVEWSQAGTGSVTFLPDNDFSHQMFYGVTAGDVVITATLRNASGGYVYSLTFDVVVSDAPPPPPYPVLTFGTPSGSGNGQTIALDISGTIPYGYSLFIVRTLGGFWGLFTVVTYANFGSSIDIDFCIATHRIQVYLVSNHIDYIMGDTTPVAEANWMRS